MRKIIVQEMITVDGFFAGLNGEIGWHVVDGEFNEYAAGFLDTIDTLIFGRITYDLMASYWPTVNAVHDDPLIASKMNSLGKLIFSKTLKEPTWNNTKVVNNIDAEEILKMKAAPGKDIAIFGSGKIVSAFTKLGLIDEYRLIVNPVVLEKGMPLFVDCGDKFKLKLLKSKEFASGNVMLCYELVRK